jgi:hypothetical protein
MTASRDATAAPLPGFGIDSLGAEAIFEVSGKNDWNMCRGVVPLKDVRELSHLNVVRTRN